MSLRADGRGNDRPHVPLIITEAQINKMDGKVKCTNMDTIAGCYRACVCCYGYNFMYFTQSNIKF